MKNKSFLALLFTLALFLSGYAVMEAQTIRQTITNIGTNTITITDTAPLIMAGNLALGQYDNLTLRSDGTRWIEMGRSNN